MQTQNAVPTPTEAKSVEKELDKYIRRYLYLNQADPQTGAARLLSILHRFEQTVQDRIVEISDTLIEDGFDETILTDFRERVWYCEELDQVLVDPMNIEEMADYQNNL